tara:strand:- start:517 stop:1500 length:984 start_codon:yes stop_codon:yes gene_type:complete
MIEVRNLKKTFSTKEDSFPHQKSTKDQSTNNIFMIRPLSFNPNKEAQKDNHFINKNVVTEKPKAKALLEWSQFTDLLLKEGITIHYYESLDKATPDAIFPNNWFSSHRNQDGSKTLCLYPMYLENRRGERKEEIIQYLQEGHSKTVDLSFYENLSNPLFLEGTGSLILDRVGYKAYAAISKRTDLELAKYWAETFKYKEIITFSTTKESPIYHTNIMLSLGTNFAIACLDAIENTEERKKIRSKLETTRDIITITKEQMNKFCGNVLEVKNEFDEPMLALSTRAFQSFEERQLNMLSNHVKKFIHSPINTIEDLGGGGVRCMIAELF